jgi:long-chain acyl-CoA synthetase
MQRTDDDRRAARLDAPDHTLPQLLVRHATTTPHGTALRAKRMGLWEPISWQAYAQAARCVALGLRELGLKRGDRIVIASEGSPEWFYADLGAEMIGVEVVGIYPTNPSAELRYVAGHCGARLAVCGDQEQTDKVLAAMQLEGGLPALEHVLCVDTKGLRGYDRAQVRGFDELVATGRRVLESDAEAAAWLEREIAAAAVTDVNVLIYTSGTTGPPKGAKLTHLNLTTSAAAFAQAAGLRPGDYESVCYLPLCHVAERSYSMVLHLVLGGVVNFAESTDTVAANIREIAPTFFLGVPRIWEKLQQHLLYRSQERGNPWRRPFAHALRRGRALAEAQASGNLSRLQRLERALWHALFFDNVQRHLGLDRARVLVCGGASVSPETLLFFEAIGLRICQGWGLTESCGMAFVQRPDRPSRIGSCGLPLEGVRWRLDGDGEILVQSPAVFAGYLNDPAATADTFTEDGFLRTGDIAQIDAAGELVVVDRKKAIIITSGGKNVAPSEIENALRDSPYVREAIVVGDGRKYLGALIQIDFDTVGRWAAERDIPYSNYRSLTQQAPVHALVRSVVDEVNGRFARVENVRRFVILDKELDHDDGELTATQKIRRSIIEKRFARELREIYDEDDPAWEPPATSLPPASRSAPSTA